jgi:hypothetical protein
MKSQSKIILIPLDERPVNTKYPEMLAAIAGAELRLPPVEIRGFLRIPADVDALIHWLRQASQDADVCIASCEYLGYGSLINARISDDNAAEVLARLNVLAEVGARIPVHAFSLITRVSNADDCVEEPLYWLQWGTKFYRFARLYHRNETGDLTETEQTDLASLAAELPHELVVDWLTRRLRNHAVNLAMLEMAARGQIASLLMTSDDTAPYGFPTRERDWLRGWPKLIGAPLEGRVRMYPGADEVGSALVARQINEAGRRAPKVFVDYAIGGDEEIVAPYEDRPVRETVLGQIEACGCVVVDTPGEADFVLGVVTPSPRRADWRLEFFDPDRTQRTEAYQAFLSRLASYAPTPIALADVAYPNGSDPVFSELLLGTHPASFLGTPPEAGREGVKAARVDLGSLAAYGAWNTAGNTLGVVVAQASLATTPSADVEAQKRFLAHRFIEDYGYQMIVRREARADAESRWSRREPDPQSPEEQQVTCAFIERRLGEILLELQGNGIGEGLKIAPGSVRLPWRRTFEVDFELV